MRASLALLLLATCDAAGWSFKSFLAGEWELERQRNGVLSRANYALEVVDANLEGSYHEVGEGGQHVNERRVLVSFSDSEERAGSFQLGKVANDVDQPPPLQQVFDFEFAAQLDERFWLSDTQWLGKNGGRLQFATIDSDAFVISHIMAGEDDPAVSTWTASRKGAQPRPRADEPKRKSLLQRYGLYLLALIAMVGYRVAKGGAKQKQQ